MNNEHLLKCSYLNEGRDKNVTLEQLRNGNINEKIKVLELIQEKTKKKSTALLKMKMKRRTLWDCSCYSL